MNKLEKLPNLQEIQIREHNLKTSIVIAMERTRTDAFNIENLVKDVLSEFPKLPSDDFTTAIRNGSLGKYGPTYKFSTQIICVWIREYLKEKNKKTLSL